LLHVNKGYTDFQAIYGLRAQLKVPSLNDLELICRIKKELIRRRTEIDAMTMGGKRKEEVIEVYAELLTNMDLDKVN
jgi:hypothetical protein